MIEPSREMQRLVRAMLTSFGVRAIRMFADSQRAATSILADPPAVVLMDWDCEPYSGPNFLKLFRHKRMYPICLMPIVMMFAEAQQNPIERALKLGAHAVVVKPIAPRVLFDRIRWAVSGAPEMELIGERYMIEGVNQRLDAERDRQSQLDEAREFQESQFNEMTDLQNEFESILRSSV